MAERKKRPSRHELSAIVEIRLVANTIEIEALARYMCNVGNLKRIREILGDTIRSLRTVRARADDCPGGWTHERDCRCVSPELVLEATLGKNLRRPLLRPRSPRTLPGT